MEVASSPEGEARRGWEDLIFGTDDDDDEDDTRRCIRESRGKRRTDDFIPDDIPDDVNFFPLLSRIQ
eukprot:CAMPEP_0182461642 /NCGR_PEP_ID=MMETSP1319-20130603/6163_1 /TAXON_ID=172717 /ORGANISM="Bolidomonas pacifica, Strain RCC208" /LENGTH=66 /DNA_ID=CAMNT_0024660957 /DNA_START=683 /DNA_END=881 /DNA_ORIENTATION=-